ncbi:unnamed protein product [Nesidiocoris tenuis]|uniref:Glutamyl-tRNA(Gln) amidotransferase subunit C, mitochondrial n=1 Tax=Nesidiocoris tenuis TaxID=355587 RepID=A0A6H5G9Q1_9HEMI|nr:unnamed protein product [Nesidiocoris tenuis]
MLRAFLTTPFRKNWRRYCSLVPDEPVVEYNRKLADAVGQTTIDQKTIEQLERNSLVDFGNEKGIQIVEEAIKFADQLSSVDTEGVEPLWTVLEDSTLFLREDEVTDCGNQELILSNAAVTEEGYFVSPPGNIPLETKVYDLKKPNSTTSPENAKLDDEESRAGQVP